MAYPIRTCIICSQEFELKPDKPGFANRCPDCGELESDGPRGKGNDLKADGELNAERRRAMRDLLYRKDS
jgi:hypothetical protein